MFGTSLTGTRFSIFSINIFLASFAKLVKIYEQSSNLSIISVRRMSMRKKQILRMSYDRMRKLIDDLGLKQRDFAKSVGLSLSGLSTILRGKSPVSRTLALAVEAVHGYRAEWILEGKGLQRVDLRERLEPITNLTLEVLANNPNRWSYLYPLVLDRLHQDAVGERFREYLRNDGDLDTAQEIKKRGIA